jgi:hypothetical protein
MPPLRTKNRVVTMLNTERQRLEKNIAGLSEADLLKNGVVGEWSIKDVLAHLADWEAHMPVWLAAARRGDPVAEIEEGLHWGEYHQFNERIYQRHKAQTLVEVLALFSGTHRHFMVMVEGLPEDEMLQPGRYAMTGKKAIYDWLIGYAGHDRWAKTEIRQWMKRK